MWEIDALLFYMIYSLPIYVGVRLIYLKLKCRKIQLKKNWLRELILAMLVIYSFGLLIMLLSPTGRIMMWSDFYFTDPIERLTYGYGFNFIPFKTIMSYSIATHNLNTIIVNILGNVLVFIPIGFGLTILWKKWQRLINVLLISLLLPVTIEFIQSFIGRSVDIDDVILNFTGTMIGFLLGKLFIKLFAGFYENYIAVV